MKRKTKRQAEDAALQEGADGWKDAKKAHEAGIAATRRKMALLAEEMEDRAEMRPVDCEWFAAPALGWKFLVRADTGSAIEQRPLTDDERQVKIGDEGMREASTEDAARWAAELAAENAVAGEGDAESEDDGDTRGVVIVDDEEF